MFFDTPSIQVIFYEVSKLYRCYHIVCHSERSEESVYIYLYLQFLRKARADAQ